MENEIKLMREYIRHLLRERFGAKSDQLSPQQIELLKAEPSVVAQEVEAEADLPEEEKAAPQEQPARKRNHPGRAELPAHLERVVQKIECTQEQCRCQQCGGEKKVIGFDRSEELDVRPAVYFVRVTEREKRACAKCEEMGVSMAPLPAKIIEKAKAGNGLVIDILVKKICDHMPLYRQAAALKRDAGIDLSRTTLCGWIARSSEWLAAIVAPMKEDLIGGNYIQADETTVGVQPETPNGKNDIGYMWQYSRPGGPVVFDFQMSRSREGPAKFLEKFGGRLQCDGYDVYDKIGQKGIVFGGCFAHARRKFVDAFKLNEEDTFLAAIIAEIGKLYAIEEQARELRLSNNERKELRQKESAPLLATLKEKIVAARIDAKLPGGAVVKACDYALEQWSRLIVYLEYEEMEIDNNLCENAMRPLALGRKNWLHIGGERFGPGTAALYSVIETCRRFGINTREYLTDVLPKVPAWPLSRIAELTPMAWMARRAAN